MSEPSEKPLICIHTAALLVRDACLSPSQRQAQAMSQSHRSIQTQVRSEETDKGSEAGIGQLIDCIQIHPRRHPCLYKPSESPTDFKQIENVITLTVENLVYPLISAERLIH